MTNKSDTSKSRKRENVKSNLNWRPQFTCKNCCYECAYDCEQL